MNTALRTSVLLSVQRALVGEIESCMRAIAVAWTPKKIELRVYTEGEASAKIKEDFYGCAVEQVVADFAWPERGDPEVACSFERCDHPSLVPAWGEVVFARAGVHFQQGKPAAG